MKKITKQNSRTREFQESTLRFWLYQRACHYNRVGACILLTKSDIWSDDIGSPKRSGLFKAAYQASEEIIFTLIFTLFGVKIVNEIILGSALDVLKDLDDELVDTCVTSPLYWSPWAHPKTKLVTWAPFGNHGSWEGELSLEPSIDMYIAHLMQIFDEVKRVLKKHGSCWIVMGDVLVNKRLKLVPEHFAIEMTKRGWILRSKIAWHKSNKPMSISIKDRFNKDWDYIFHFTRSKRYYFDGQSELSSNIKMQSVWDIPLTPKVKNYTFEAYPKELVTIPILTTCPVNGIVLDPFIGSGTTAVVALELKRNFVGIEISDTSVNIASNRIKPFLKHVM